MKQQQDGDKLGSMIAYITDYMSPRNEGAPKILLGTNAKYTIKMTMTPKGVHVMGNIV